MPGAQETWSHPALQQVACLTPGWVAEEAGTDPGMSGVSGTRDTDRKTGLCYTDEVTLNRHELRQ